MRKIYDSIDEALAQNREYTIFYKTPENVIDQIDCNVDQPILVKDGMVWYFPKDNDDELCGLPVSDVYEIKARLIEK